MILRLSIFLQFVSCLVYANTEIVNFVAPSILQQDVVLASSCPILSKASPNWRGKISPPALNNVTASEWLWVALDLDSWRQSESFTLRVSWSAWDPVDFIIEVLHLDHVQTSELYLERASHSTLNRKRLARLQIIEHGVPVPSWNPPRDDVRFNLVLEELHYGVLPTSVIRTVLVLIVVSGVAGLFVAPFVHSRCKQLVRSTAKADALKTR